MKNIVAVFIWLLFAIACQAKTPGFYGTGQLPGCCTITRVNKVSPEGSVAVGSSMVSRPIWIGSGLDPCPFMAFVWTEWVGIQGLGFPVDCNGPSEAYGVSAYGTVVVGGSCGAFRWTTYNGMEALSGLPDDLLGSTALAVSADGSVIVGTIWSLSGQEAFRWESGVITRLGHLTDGYPLSGAFDVSANGSVVVGYSHSTSGREAFRWTEEDGIVGLDDLPGGNFDSSASAVSADGLVIVGEGCSDAGKEAFRWTESEGMDGLGDLPGGDFYSFATDVSADGSIIIGGSISAIGGRPFIWDQKNGMRDLMDMLVNDLGFDLNGWQLGAALSISDDGLTIVGNGLNPDGYPEGWIAVLPKSEPTIIYVDANAPTGGDGNSWSTALNHLQHALSVAYSRDEIRVGQGIYKPASPIPPSLPLPPPPPDIPEPPLPPVPMGQTMPQQPLRPLQSLNSASEIALGGRKATFWLTSGVIVKGGYAGPCQSDPNARDIELYETILSGDLNNNDVEVANPKDLLNDPCRSENSYQVITAIDCDETTLLDGLTIAAGNANETLVYPPDLLRYKGGGMYNANSNLVVKNCTFNNNSAEYGGGMANINTSSPTLINCKFTHNGAVSGGGMNNHNSNPILINCLLSNNSALYGGGMDNYGDNNSILTNCTFTGNRATREGGAIRYRYPPPPPPSPPTLPLSFVVDTINSSTITDNLVTSDFNDCNVIYPVITNCIFWDNRIINSTDESAQISMDPKDTPIIINYNCIQGWTGALGGTSNIYNDPCFVEPGYWSSNGTAQDANDDFWIDGDYHLLTDSPCIDTGDPNYVTEPNDTDFDGRPRVINGRIDMGAYEYISSISAWMDIEPNTLNLTSKGKWITAFIWLPEEYNVADINPNSVFLEGKIKPEQLLLAEDEQVAIAKFDRGEVQSILDIGEVELTISGRLTDDTLFEAKDTLKVIDKSRGKSVKQHQPAR